MDGVCEAEMACGCTTLVVAMYTNMSNQNEKPNITRRAEGQATGSGGRAADAAEWVRTALGFHADAAQQEI